MKIHKLSSTDAFIAFEYEDVPAVGITRLARKVLQDGATLLARSTTYSFACFGVDRCGGSAGINAEGDDRDDAVAAFVEEARALVADGRWATDPGLGLTEEDLAPLRIVDQRPPGLWSEGLDATLTARGAIAAAGAARDGGMTGARVAIVGGGPVVEAARTAVTDAGGEVVDGGLDADADVLLVAGKAGAVDHDAAATVRAGVVVPLTPVPITARAHAVLSQAGTVHVPDFVAVAAPLLHAHAPDVADPVEAVAGVITELRDRGTGLWMAAVERAETFLQERHGELPFGRPLA